MMYGPAHTHLYKQVKRPERERERVFIFLYLFFFFWFPIIGLNSTQRRRKIRKYKRLPASGNLCGYKEALLIKPLGTFSPYFVQGWTKGPSFWRRGQYSSSSSTSSSFYVVLFVPLDGVSSRLYWGYTHQTCSYGGNPVRCGWWISSNENGRCLGGKWGLAKRESAIQRHNNIPPLLNYKWAQANVCVDDKTKKKQRKKRKRKRYGHGMLNRIR